MLCLLLTLAGLIYFYSQDTFSSSPNVVSNTHGNPLQPVGVYETRQPTEPKPLPTKQPTHEVSNEPQKQEPPPKPKPTKATRYTYKVEATYPHNSRSFTQGLEIVDGKLYEGTGLNGNSKLLLVDMETGKSVKSHSLETKHFGEGITVFNGKIYQLTWQSQIGFIYDLDSFDLLGKYRMLSTQSLFSQLGYPHEGWGITHDDRYLIVSDGSNKIRFWEPEVDPKIEALPVVKTLEVKYQSGRPANFLNELEYINGQIWANVWQDDNILMIDPETGLVTGVIDLRSIRATNNAERIGDDVLNGIAYDNKNGDIYVTGKLWSTLYKISIVPKDK